MSFGECELELRSRRLRRPGGQTVLQEQPFRILLRLLGRPGEVVTREEIRQELWADETFVDFEHGINAAVKRLREALGDSTEKPRYVETVPRQGYRLIAPLAGAVPGGATAETPRRPRPRWLHVAGAALLLAAVAAAGVLGMRARRGQALEPRAQRLAVAVFENRTGDAGLDALGLMASDWIAQGLLQDLGLDVVPGLVVLELELGSRGVSPTPYDKVRRLGGQVRAGLIVSGEYYQIGDELRFQARLTDLAGRVALPRLEPVAGPRAAPMEVVQRLRAQVLGAVGLSVKGAGPMTEQIPPRMLGKPPVYEAYREFVIAMRYGEEDREKHVLHLERALELDPGFSVPVPRLFIAYFNGGEFEKADRLMKRTWDLVPPGLEPLRDHLAARLGGHLERAHELALQVHRLLPRNPATVNMAAGSALLVGRPREARRLLDGLDPPSAGPRWWTLSGQADHLLGRYDRELEAGRAGQAAHPAAAWPREAQVRALAAAGREEDLAAVIRESQAALTQRGGATPAHLMVRAAQELRAHGHREASTRLATQALEWLAHVPPRGAASEPLRGLRGEALIALERWEEAQAVFADLASEHPASTRYLGEQGVLAARRGRKQEAAGIDRDLARLDRPGLLGENTCWRAAIAAAFGERDRALGLLRQAFAEGKPLAWSTHADAAFESLRGAPGYEALALPRK